MEKEDMPVIDFTDFPSPNTEAFLWMPVDEFENFEICCDYIQLGTSVPSGTKVETGFYCRQEMENGELCDGSIDVYQIDVPKQIRWECRKCGDMGAIINFEESVWDNSPLSEEQKEIFLENFFSDILEEDIMEDEFYDLDENEVFGPFDDFEYYVNPYDPDGEQSGDPPSELIEEMLTCDWMNPESPVYLNDDISLKELENSFFFYNARQFLLTLQEDGSFPLTRAEYLKRKVVRRLLDETRWPENYIERISRNRKYLDETDVWLLHGIRILLDLGNLIKQNKKTYQLNKNLQHLLDENNAGQLYRHLFSTYFKEMNLGYLGSTFELPHLQYSFPFILYKLQKLAKEWVSVEDLLPKILLFPVSMELQFEDVEDMGLAHDILHEDLFSALDRFALLESRQTNGSQPHEIFTYADQVKITPLFKKFIHFNV